MADGHEVGSAQISWTPACYAVAKGKCAPERIICARGILGLSLKDRDLHVLGHIAELLGAAMAFQGRSLGCNARATGSVQKRMAIAFLGAIVQLVCARYKR